MNVNTTKERLGLRVRDLARTAKSLVLRLRRGQRKSLNESEERVANESSSLTWWERDPTEPRAWVQAARLAWKSGDISGTRRASKRALQIAPRNSAAWSMLALAEQRDGHFAAALDAAEHAIQPGVPSVRSAVSVLTWVFREARATEPSAALTAARSLLSAAMCEPSAVSAGVSRAAALYVIEMEAAATNPVAQEVESHAIREALKALEGDATLTRQRVATVSRLVGAKKVRLADEVIGRGPFESSHRPLLRRLANNLEAEGYLERALHRWWQAVQLEPTISDQRKLTALESEISVLSGRWQPKDPPPERIAKSARRVLHVVGKSMPAVQSGYTLRTAYTVQAQVAAGLDPVVVTQPGVPVTTEAAVDLVGGVPHYRLKVPERRLTRTEAVQLHIDGLATVIRQVKPALIHAHSDFYNALAAIAAGRSFDIPVVYEARGFWEETWLSRHGEHRADSDVYQWRREREHACRQAAAHVITLAPSMKSHIVSEGLPAERVSIVPNAAELRSAPPPEPSDDLAATLELPPGTVVAGYISSLVAYEGTDVLVQAILDLRRRGVAVRGLVVGDGPQLPKLKDQVAAADDLEAVIFTGKVPHDKVHDYYALIDVFVIPRKPFRVCHLVSPLKPYEALLSGTAVIASDVAALADIAEESRSIELFKAGDPASLAAVLSRLVEQPERRDALAEQGRAWVLRERSWRQNAAKYFDIYTTQGFLKRSDLEAQGHVSLPVPAARKLLAGNSRPLEALASVDRSTARTRQSADAIMNTGWEHLPYGTLALSPDVDWDKTCPKERSWAFRMQSWDWLAPVLVAWEQSSDTKYLNWAVSMVRSWHLAHSNPDVSDRMAWYDMAVGLRGHRLGYLVAAASKYHRVSNADMEYLLACVRNHQRALADPGIFARHSNHGLYVAAGQAALARHLAGLPGMAWHSEQANDRLSQMLTSQFAPDGAHREHSPDYHRMVLGTLRALVDSGLVEDREILELIQRADELLGWFIQPDGTLLQFGDTHRRDMSAAAKTALSETSKWALSGGRLGVPPNETMRVAPQGGYAVTRVANEAAADNFAYASYFAIQAGFHSRVHKHADDLAIVWWDRGVEVCVDPGSFGYVDPLPADSPLRLEGFFYSAPERRYVESTRAHCTVEIDGRDHDRRTREPYGSAPLLGSVCSDGNHRISAQVKHGSVEHSRLCVLCPGNWLLVADRLTAQDGQQHTYRQWFTLAEDWDVQVSNNGFRASQLDLNLYVSPLTSADTRGPVRGETTPQLLGWRSRSVREFQPAPTISLETSGSSSVIVTLLSFDHAPVGGRLDADRVSFSLGGELVVIPLEW